MRLRLVAIFLLMVMLTGLLPWNLFIDRGEAISHGKIVILSNVDNSIPGIVDAYKKLHDQGYNFELKIFSGSDLVNSETVDKLKQEVQAANLLLMDMIGSSSYQTVINFLPDVPQTTKIVSIRSNVFSSVDRIDSSQDTVLKPYFDNGGPENMRRYLLNLLKNYCNVPVNEAIDPLPAEARFIYHPDALGSVERAVYENVYEDVYEDVYQGPSPQGTFTTFADYAFWYKKQGKYKENAPWVGIMTFNSYFKGNDISLYEALLRSLEAKGVNVILVFTDSNKQQAVRDFLMENEQARIDFFIAAMGFNFVYGNSQAGIDLFKRMNVPVMAPVAADDLTNWEQNPAGISDAVWWQIAYPELDGRIEPILMGGKTLVNIDEDTGAKIVKNMPLVSGIERVTGRVMSWINLRKKPNSEKKIAIIYYNHDGGKDGIGAAYLNVFSSLSTILKALQGHDYTVDGNLDTDALQDLIFRQGRNIGSWAPGELKTMVNNGALTIPLDKYLEWYQELPAELREQVEKEWGPPPGKIMTLDDQLVIPGAMLGNIFIGPQPMRGWGDEPEKIAHSPSLPPTHQYLAYYFWLQKEYQADAIIHLGTHGTLEWLPGRSVGLGQDDWPDILLGNIPNIYPYIVNNPGEATQAKRRGYAVTIGHLTPPMIKPQLYGDLAELQQLIADYQEAASKGDSGRMAALQQQIIELSKTNNLDQDLGLDLNNNENFAQVVEKLQAYLEQLTLELMPYGLHTFGQAPEGEMLDLMVDSIVSYDEANRQEFADEYRVDLQQTENEIVNLLRALNGEYIEPGLARDPVRVPDVMPTGRNLVTLDPRMIPDKAAWEVGKKAADQLLAKYLAEKGRYPDSVGVVLWAIETMRTQGETVAMIFRLIGVEPVWDKAGRVTSVKVTPLEQLGRPRIDVVVTISGLFRDTFAHTVGVLDDAFRQIALLDESAEDNHVRKHYVSMKEQLQAEGLSAADADGLAAARIFGDAPGTYGTGVSEMVKSTSAWDNKQDLVDVYMNRMAFAYGRNLYGQGASSAFTQLLTGVDVVTQVRDSLWGVLDNDDVYQYLGGLKLAAEAASGKGVETYIANTRSAVGPRIESLIEFVGTELRTRLLNPKWIEGMLKEGYAGSQEISDQLANLFGVDATLDGASDWAWQAVAQNFVLDENIRNQLDPYALQSIIGWSLEAARRQMWQADSRVLSQLADIYIQQAVKYGVVCCHHTCANLVFNEWLANYSTLPEDILQKFQTVFEQATDRLVKIPDRSIVKAENQDDQNPVAESITTPVTIQLAENASEPFFPVTQVKVNQDIRPDYGRITQVSPASDSRQIMVATKSQAGNMEVSKEQDNIEANNEAGKTAKSNQPKGRAYELKVPQQKKASSVSIPTGVTVFAIIGTLVLVGIFIKGYLAR
ncbi:cobaltochelatase CobN subunit [Carboxydocella thermautotrophica]|nr:cobaltochelatase CobN subunit [Carboxydocella thermautotrophica]